MADTWTFIAPTFWLVVKIILAIVVLLIAVAYTTYFERRVIGYMQLRRGPNVVGPFGLLQPLADGIKLFFKETIIPAVSCKWVFIMAPMLTFVLSLVAWVVIPIGQGEVFSNMNVGLLYLYAVSSLGVYGIILAGWASNTRYAFLGAMRSAAQMVSYEVSIGLILVTVVLMVGSLNLTEIVMAQKDLWFIVPLFPMFIVFLVSMLAETNRAPFDLPEAEAELVSGYNVEYASMTFAFFFLGEYANMILMSAIATTLFLGGWLAPVEILDWIPGPLWFALKVSLILFVFFWVRATFPRYRYDQLMRLGWKIFLPLTLIWVVGTAAFQVFVKGVSHGL